jgi:hypothetical protein
MTTSRSYGLLCAGTRKDGEGRVLSLDLPVEHGLELPLEPAHLGCLLADPAYPSGQVRAQSGLQRPALADRPGRDQVDDVFQAHPDALGAADERQLI